LESLEDRRMMATVYADFDGDAFDELAVGAPGEDRELLNDDQDEEGGDSTVADSGAVLVIYGSDDGLRRDRSWHWRPGRRRWQYHLASQVWNQGNAFDQNDGSPEAGDGFGGL
jgi:hypothetical protein